MRPAVSDYQHLASGKVRELYRVDDEHLLLVATDRISAYDYVLDSTIPDKGRILTAMSVFFFGLVDAPNHLAGPPDDPRIPDEVLGRALVVRLPDRLGVAGLPGDREGLRYHVAAGSGRGQQVCHAAVHPGDESRTGGPR
jgi:phosphoribosylaminoimidazole-succinocarboxamide synthase